MKTSGSATLPEELSVSRQAALLKLLTDDDPNVYGMVRAKVLSFGPLAGEWLRPHTLSNDVALRRRAQEIVLHFDRQAADNRFVAFCLRHGEEFDLEQAAWLLAQTQYPDMNAEAYSALLDLYADEIADRVAPCTSSLDILSLVNEYLFAELGFSGNQENYYVPENSYLNRVMDNRSGNPINLCLLHMLLSRRLKLPVAGIGLPGHFVCRFQSTSDEIYVDAFNHGRFLSKADCVQYLVKGNFGRHDEYLTPTTPRKLMLRICTNLHQIYAHMELEEETTRLQRYLVALSRQP